MPEFFTASERATFKSLGWETMGGSACVHFDALGFGAMVEPDGSLMVQERCEDGRWRWTHCAQCETAYLAACELADYFHRRTGWELLSWRGEQAA